MNTPKKVKAHLIKTSGEVLPLYEIPSLERARALIGGWIETLVVVDPADKKSKLMLMNEEGRMQQLPSNDKATQLVEHTGKMKGQKISQAIVGDVILLNSLRWS